MKKNVRLTESDLVRLVKRVINEQAEVENQELETGSFTVPSIPSNTQRCGERGIQEMSKALQYGGITHMIPDNKQRGYIVVFNNQKKYCAATMGQLKQIIGL